jgi:uncharacterized membrane protein
MESSLEQQGCAIRRSKRNFIYLYSAVIEAW